MLFPRFYFAFLCFFFVFGGTLLANPENAQVVSGQASIDILGAQLNIQATDRTIINWETFSISRNETTSIQLPTAHACILNRVMGANPSEIYGQLQSNGNVYLINPNGILVGKEGIVLTGSFCASTLAVSDSDFLQGESLIFSDQTAKALHNCGTIVATMGDVVLISAEIKNEGSIEAVQGTVALAAGREVRLLPHGDEKIQIRLQSKPVIQAEGTGIHQAGQVQAQHVQLKADGNLYAYAIKNDGYIKASKFEHCGGSVVLVAEKGHVNHSGKIEAEDVQILGEYVTLVGNAVVDASQVSQGGTVLIGGDFQGNNPKIINAKGTLVEENVVISTDALEKGNGGRVVIWADETTGFYGKVFSRGGNQQGDGGFVEVSGKDVLDFRGQVNTLALNGKTGTLLLDPTDITISAAATDAGIVFGGACGVNTFCNTGVLSPRNINNTAITTQLGLSNVIINSNVGGPAGGNGDITFTAVFTWSGANTNTFTLNARRNIAFNANFTNSTTAGVFVANAGQGILGTITIAAAVTVAHSSAGGITFNANTTAGSDIVINGILNVTGGNLTMILNDDFTLAATPAAIIFNSPGNTFSFTTTAAAGSIATFTGPITVNGIANFTTSGTLILGNVTTSGTNTFTINSVGNVTTTAGTTFLHNSTGALSINVTGVGSDLLPSGNMTVNGANLTLIFNDDFTLAAGATLNFNSPGNTFILTATVPATSVTTFAGDVIVNGIVNWNTGALNINATFTSSGTGAVTMSSTLVTTMGAASIFNHNSTGDLIITSTTSDITVSGLFNVTNSNATFNTSDDFTLTATTGILNFSAAGKALIFTPGGTTSYNFNGAMNVTGGSLLVTANDDIIVGAAGSIIYNVVGGSAVFIAVGGADPDLTMNGLFTITNGALTITAFDDIVIGVTGTFNFNSPNAAIISATGTDGDIMVNGAMNITNGTSMTMLAVDDITFATGSTVTYSSPGAWIVTTTGATAVNSIVINGTLTISNGAVTMTASGAVTIATGIIPINYTSPLPWIVTANLGNITISSQINLTTAASFSMTTLATDILITNLVRNFTLGNISAVSARDLTVGSFLGTTTAQIGSSGGLTRLTAVRDLTIISSDTTPGASALVGFSGGLTGSVVITVGGNMLIQSQGTNDAEVESPSTLTIDVTGDLALVLEPFLTSTGQARIIADGDTSITAEDITLSGSTNSSALISTSSGDLLIIAQNDMIILLNSFISNLGNGNLTLVVDQQAPLPPEVGPGRFNLFLGSQIQTNGGQLGIFTASQSQNVILGTINGLSFTAGNEEFGVWFSTFTGTSEPPFTIYYKIGSAIPSTISVFGNTAASEMIQTYFDRALGWAWISSFWTRTPDKYNGYSLWYRKPFEYVIYLPWSRFYREMSWRDAATRVSL